MVLILLVVVWHPTAVHTRVQFPAKAWRSAQIFLLAVEGAGAGKVRVCKILVAGDNVQIS